MVPYEFWRIYLDADNDSTREVICRQALEQYPKFMIMANELAALLIEQKNTDGSLSLGMANPNLRPKMLDKKNWKEIPTLHLLN